MPIRHRIAAGTGVIAIAGAIALAGAAPASAHTGQFFTYAEAGDDAAFSTISTSDATITNLPTVTNLDLQSIEIWGEQGYALVAESQFTFSLYFWDHTTGAVTGSVPLTLDPAFSEGTQTTLLSIFSLDTTKGSTLADGTVLTFASINFGNEANVGLWLSSIAPATGIITPLVDVTALEEEANLFVDSLATDPTTGVTYAFVDYNDGIPQYSVIDIAGTTYSVPVPMTGVSDVIGPGYIQGADYSDDGLLYFINSNSLFARLTGAITSNSPALAIGAEVELEYSPYALAYDPAPKLADTGLNFVNPAIAALALLGLGGAVVVISRRRLTA